MNQPSFDLLKQPWIAVQGAPEPVDLPTLFTRAHTIADIEWPYAPAASGLVRVLTTLAARFTGLDQPGSGVSEWTKRREAILAQGVFNSGDVEKYFAIYADRFDLFGPRPFLQDPRLASECAKTSGVNKLVPRRPSGNNQVLFDHNSDVAATPVDPVTALWGLLTLLYYGPSGRCTARKAGSVSAADSRSGPLRRSISYHPVGSNLFESLVLSIPYPEVDGDGVDEAPWEAADLANTAGAPPIPGGVAGVLTGRFQHAVLLVPSTDGSTVTDCHLTWAWRYPVPDVDDPYLVYLDNSKGEKYARFADADRDLWRDIDSLLLTDAGEEHRSCPAIFDGLQHGVSLETLESLRVRAFGFDQDGQTRDKLYFTASTPRAIVQRALDPDGAWNIRQTRAAAEKTASYLGSALRHAWVAVNDPSDGKGKPARSDIPSGAWPARGLAHYWPKAERLFWSHVRSEDEPEDVAAQYVRLALDAYDTVLDFALASPRMARAITLNRTRIFGALPPRESGGSS